jgi:isopentenyl diphosphate isomerase/L-lactate dehydrogenase-like FMN-dependent dehydrogenase
MNRASLQRYGYNVHALRELARKRLPRMVFDMVDGAAGDERTVRRNQEDIADIRFVPKVLAGAGTRNQSVEIFGHKLASPVIIGPTGLAGLLYPRAELEAARAAARFGTIYTTSHASTCTIEEIAASTRGPKWMQVFLYKDRGLTAEFVNRAKASGYAGLVLTVDNQVMAVRDRDARNGLMFPMKLRARGLLDLASHPGWLMRMRKAPNPTFVNYGTRTSIGALGMVMAEQLDPSVGWKEVEWVRSLWDGPMILKGILHPDEARTAQSIGIDGLVVSNHGGRQLDGAISGIEALGPIADAVGSDMVVIVDGGFRRGADVVKALALGAKAVIIGRPQLWGVACGGEEGVHWVLEIFAREIDRAMALGSWDGIDKLNRDILRLPSGPAR